MLDDSEVNKILRDAEMYGASYVKVVCNPETAEIIMKKVEVHEDDSLYVPVPLLGSMELVKSSLVAPDDWFMCDDPELAEMLRWAEKVLKTPIGTKIGYRFENNIKENK